MAETFVVTIDAPTRILKKSALEEILHNALADDDVTIDVQVIHSEEGQG
jgi:hypothetical protein